MRSLLLPLALAMCVFARVAEAAPEAPSFLYAAEGSNAVIRYDGAGKIVWQYQAEMCRDAWRLPNGNVLFCYNEKYDSRRHDNASGVVEVTPERRIVFQFATTGQVWACQRLAGGETLVGAASQGKLLIVDARGAVVKEIPVRSKPGHSCMRYARGLANGNFLVAEESARQVREYTREAALVREIAVDFPPFGVVRLENGNTLISGRTAIVEVAPAGQTVWRLEAAEVPQLGIRWFAGFEVLPGGILFVCNAGGKVPAFEITRDVRKQVLWQSGPLAIGHGVQLLDLDSAVPALR